MMYYFHETLVMECFVMNIISSVLSITILLYNIGCMEWVKLKGLKMEETDSDILVETEY
jgi:hypothetical protein